MTITIYRGNQIGGCITQIESAKGSKIQIDFGHNLPEGDKPANDKYDDPKELENLLNGVSDIYYTHYHGDHIGFESQINQLSQTQHIGKLSLDIVRTLKRHMKNAPIFEEDATRSLEALNKFKTYVANHTEMVGKHKDIEITPFYVSHSAIDAHMFLIHCDGKYVLHTGDFRDHGYMGEGMVKVLQKLILPKHSIDVLITEGTMLSRGSEKVMSEKELMQKARAIFKQYKYAFVLQSSTDIDRLLSFYLATCPNRKSNKKWYGRMFVTDGYQQAQIRNANKLKGPYKTIRSANIWHKHEGMLYLMRKRGFTMLVRNSETFQKLIDEIVPLIDLEHTIFIFSQWHGYIDTEGKSKNQSAIDFIHRYPWHFMELHTSGHASKEALEEVCNLANPTTAIIPIHKDPDSDFRLLNIQQELKDCVYTESTEVEGIKIQINN